MRPPGGISRPSGESGFFLTAQPSKGFPVAEGPGGGIPSRPPEHFFRSVSFYFCLAMIWSLIFSYTPAGRTFRETSWFFMA